jgi:hypothetical protein
MLTPDSIVPSFKKPQNLNLYTYSLNNPINLTDPSGLCAEVGDEVCWGLAERAWRAGLGTLAELGILTEQELRDLLSGKPVIISRQEWGAVEPTVGILYENEPDKFALQYAVGYGEGFYDPILNTGGYACYEQLFPNEPLAEILKTIVIHHEGDNQTYDIRQVQLEHMIMEGWTDIGYHYAIGLDGRIFEGRDINVRGSHVNEANTGRIGILFLGDFHPGIENRFDITVPDILSGDNRPSPQLVASAIELIRWLDLKYGIEEVVAHRDVPNNFTVCPGEYCMYLIPFFNSIVQEQ